MEVVKHEIEAETYFGRCKCCLEYGYMKNIWSEHSFEGESEIYGEMLRETFLITSDKPGKEEHICESCISRLRDAYCFKKEVLASIEILRRYEENEFEVPILTKAEMSDQQLSDEEVEYLEDAALGDIVEEYKEPEYQDIEYLEEDEAVVAAEITRSTAEAPINKGPKKKRKGHPNIFKQYTETDLRTAVEAVLNKLMTPNEAAKMYNVPRRTISARATYMKSKQDERDKEHRQTIEVRKHRDNIRAILEYTNATPFRGHCGVQYSCCFCHSQYNKPSDLKIHTQKHNKMADELQIKVAFDFVLKLDITRLICKICLESIGEFGKLLSHLKSHDKLVYTDINNQILPFSFEEDELRCVICKLEFKYFKLLLEHMVSHYDNYTCTICGKGFVNKRSLTNHMSRHDFGVYTCSYCSKEFDSRAKMKSHERVLHVHKSKTRKCRYCDERLMSAAQRNKHEVKHHNAQQDAFKCVICGKIFGSQFSLSAHTRRMHLMLKPLECSECNMRFHAKEDLKGHMVKHTGEKNYQCEFCSKTYGRKRTLREHLRIHYNDRRFKCDHCGQAFVQKCSWKGHMRARHGVDV